MASFIARIDEQSGEVWSVLDSRRPDPVFRTDTEAKGEVAAFLLTEAAVLCDGALDGNPEYCRGVAELIGALAFDVEHQVAVGRILHALRYPGEPFGPPARTE